MIPVRSALSFYPRHRGSCRGSWPIVRCRHRANGTREPHGVLRPREQSLSHGSREEEESGASSELLEALRARVRRPRMCAPRFCTGEKRAWPQISHTSRSIEGDHAEMTCL